MPTWDLSDEVLEQYIETFYGHGGYEAKYWFVGMEFGGGNSEAEIVKRIQGWHDRGDHELEDLSGPQGMDRDAPFFRPPFPVVPTWAGIIRVTLSAEGQTATMANIRNYQVEKLGRKGSLDCLLELLPLPSPGVGKFLF